LSKFSYTYKTNISHEHKTWTSIATEVFGLRLKVQMFNHPDERS